MESIEITQNIKIPNYITINNFKYSFKRKLVEEKYSYRLLSSKLSCIDNYR